MMMVAMLISVPYSFRVSSTIVFNSDYSIPKSEDSDNPQIEKLLLELFIPAEDLRGVRF
jgi:hypothetical protein